MTRDTDPIEIGGMPDVVRPAEEVRASGRPRVLRRADEDVAVLVPAGHQRGPSDPDDIWAGYDPERVRRALEASIGALAGVEIERLKADLRAQREQESGGRPA